MFREIKGPYSLILYDALTKTLFWARDSLGRNSLLMGFHNNDSQFYISSVNGNGLRNKAIEVPPLGLYSFKIDSRKMGLVPWTDEMKDIEYYQETLAKVEEFFNEKFTFLVDNSKSINPYWLKCIDIAPQQFRFDDLLKNFQEKDPEKIIDYLLSNEKVSHSVDKFIKLLTSSLGDRIEATPNICVSCRIEHEGQLSCDHPKVGILFSGGVDCSLLAVLADQLIDSRIPINLYNVAFEKAGKSSVPNWNVPDRISAMEALDELRKINPIRNWNFVEINVPREKLDHHLINTISHLVYPLDTILDESLGGALWFASGGATDMSSSDFTCRVLLIGSGADELLGGYTRHRNAYRRTGCVAAELLHDWHRLPSRNLGRDDRVISDNGVTPRAPFVEEDFVHFIRNLHPMEKCHHGLAEGLGDKLLLRLAAYRLGLRETSIRRKRALQFGSRVAVSSRQNAKDKSSFLE